MRIRNRHKGLEAELARHANGLKLHTIEHLDLYLVVNDMKPVALFSSAPKSQKRERIRMDLSKFGLVVGFGNPHPTKHSVDRGNLVLGTDRQNVDRLLRAGSDMEIGTALGYPSETVTEYVRLRESGISPGLVYVRSIMEAKHLGMGIPDWLGYIGYVPVPINLVRGHVSATVMEQGQAYMEFLRSRNPALATLVEKAHVKRIKRLFTDEAHKLALLSEQEERARAEKTAMRG